MRKLSIHDNTLYVNNILTKLNISVDARDISINLVASSRIVSPLKIYSNFIHLGSIVFEFYLLIGYRLLNFDPAWFCKVFLLATICRIFFSSLEVRVALDSLRVIP